MAFIKGNHLKLLPVWSAIAVIFMIVAVLGFDRASRTIARYRNAFSKAWAAGEIALQNPPVPNSTPTSTPAAAASTPAASATPLIPDALGQAMLTVEAYMRKYAAPDCVISFLDWSDFSKAGPASAVTVHYRVQQPLHPDVLASVRFTIQAGNVVKMDLVPPNTQPNSPLTPPSQPPPPDQSTDQSSPSDQNPTPPQQVTDRFSAPILAAEHGPAMTLELSNAFSLDQLDQAKAKAQAEKKPLGFIMVLAQFFDHQVDPRAKGSDSALVHFYEVFNKDLVLVFIRHENELPLAPDAVKQGFTGPDEGGYAPNMAVVDATATELITEIPFRGLDGPGRDELFAAGGKKIDQWLATHPDAVATPAAQPLGP
jgi:hypothetical protein